MSLDLGTNSMSAPQQQALQPEHRAVASTSSDAEGSVRRTCHTCRDAQREAPAEGVVEGQERPRLRAAC